MQDLKRVVADLGVLPLYYILPLYYCLFTTGLQEGRGGPEHRAVGGASRGSPRRRCSVYFLYWYKKYLIYWYNSTSRALLAAAAGAPYTCFTGTKVQTLTRSSQQRAAAGSSSSTRTSSADTPRLSRTSQRLPRSARAQVYANVCRRMLTYADVC